MRIKRNLLFVAINSHYYFEKISALSSLQEKSTKQINSSMQSVHTDWLFYVMGAYRRFRRSQSFMFALFYLMSKQIGGSACQLWQALLLV